MNKLFTRTLMLSAFAFLAVSMNSYAGATDRHPCPEKHPCPSATPTPKPAKEVAATPTDTVKHPCPESDGRHPCPSPTPKATNN